MVRSKARTAAEKLRLLSSELLDLAELFEIPSMTIARHERLTDEVEQAAKNVRAVVRG